MKYKARGAFGEREQTGGIKWTSGVLGWDMSAQRGKEQGDWEGWGVGPQGREKLENSMFVLLGC